MKKCSRCQTTKTVEEFHKNRSRVDGLDAWCKACKGSYNQRYIQAKSLRDVIMYGPQRRNNYYLRNYGITLAEYEDKLLAQRGVCEVCGKPPGKLRLSVDHDKVTGLPRGLLCGPCNQQLHVLENVPLYKSLRTYLKKYQWQKWDNRA